MLKTIKTTLYCSICEETPGRIYNNNDVTSGQWVECEHEALTYGNLKEFIEDVLWEVDQGPVDISEEVVKGNSYVVKELKNILGKIV